MEAVPFHGVNVTLRGNGSTIKDLAVYSDGLACVSAWELSDEDIMLILKNRRIYLTVFHTPENFPPVGISAENPMPPLLITPSIIKP